MRTGRHSRVQRPCMRKRAVQARKFPVAQSALSRSGYEPLSDEVVDSLVSKLGINPSDAPPQPVEAVPEEPTPMRMRTAREEPMPWPEPYVPLFSPFPLDVTRLAGWRREMAWAHEAHVRCMAEVLSLNPGPFKISPERSLAIADKTVYFGSSLALGKYGAIPLFITDASGATSMVISYRSKSQFCWRRFAGAAHGIYWKGDDEHLQTLDWKLQSMLDSIWESAPAVPLLSRTGRVLTLDDLSAGRYPEGGGAPSIPEAYASQDLILLCEEAVQRSMLQGAPHFDARAASALPSHIIDYWWSGGDEDAYGRHINMLSLSRNGLYLYCLGLTEDGLFPKYIQDAAMDGVSFAGSPSRAITILDRDKWLLTPIIEYGGHDRGVREAEISKLRIEGTVILGGNRVRINGIHSSSKSPFFELDNALSDIYILLRMGRYEEADGLMARMRAGGGVLPRQAEPPTDVMPETVMPMIRERKSQLINAYLLFRQGRLGKDSGEGKANMASHQISGRDLALFQRYSRLEDSWATESYGSVAVPEFVIRMVDARLERLATQWAKDTVSARTKLL